MESCSLFENGGHGILADGVRARVHVNRCMLSYNKGAGVAADGVRMWRDLFILDFYSCF